MTFRSVVLKLCLLENAKRQKEYWAGVSDAARDFVRSCLTIDPTNRPTSSQLLQHQFLKIDPNAQQTSAAGAVDLLPNVKAAFDAKKTCQSMYTPQRTGHRDLTHQSEKPCWA